MGLQCLSMRVAVLIGSLSLTGQTPSALSAAPSAEAVYTIQVQSTVLLRSDRNAAGDAIAYPMADHPEVTGMKVKIPAGAETGWHSHTVPGYAYLLSGTLTLHYEGAPSKVFKAGEAFVESAGRLHNGRNQGSEDVVLVVFFTGDQGRPITLGAPSPKPSPAPLPKPLPAPRP